MTKCSCIIFDYRQLVHFHIVGQINGLALVHFRINDGFQTMFVVPYIESLISISQLEGPPLLELEDDNKFKVE